MILSELRFGVPDLETLIRLVAAPLPLGLHGPPATRRFHRDIYFDTPDGTLRRQGVLCRLRIELDDRRTLTVRLEESQRHATSRTDVTALGREHDPAAILAGASAPARRLQAVIDPGRLEPVLELATERYRRVARRRWMPVGGLLFLYDAVTVRQRDLERQFHELVVRRRRWSGVPLGSVARALEAAYGVRPTLTDRRVRAELTLESIESERLARAVQGRRLVTLLAVEGGRIALAAEGSALRLPAQAGSGEATCRDVMRGALGSSEGQVVLLGVVPATETRPAVEVWLARRLRRGVVGDGHAELRWFHPSELVSRVGSPVLRDPATLAALTLAARSTLLPEWFGAAPDDRTAGSGTAPDEISRASRRTLDGLQAPVLARAALDAATPSPEQFVNTELSWLEFNARVLALAEHPGTPLLARLRFLSIVSTNLDEFFMVRVAGLKQATAAGVTNLGPDGLSAQEQLSAIAIRVRALVERQYRCFHQLVGRDLPARGILIRPWSELAPADRAALQQRFDEEIFPLVTPKAITWAPGYPFPLIEELRLSLAVMVRDEQTRTTHFAHLRLPDSLPRFLPVGTERREFVPVEDVVRANIGAFYAGRTILEVHACRLTRRGELDLDEPAVADFAQALEDELRRRPGAPVVRIEVERTMPHAVRDVLLEELRFEEAGDRPTLGSPEVFEVDGLVNLGDLTEMADLTMPELQYPPFVPTVPFAEDRPIFDQLEDGDRLVHYPYDAFEPTFERFITTAADDPDVLAIKLTLYRPGGPSAIGDALHRAAAAGKDVSVFVELKARFDEQRNIHWARTLERQGIHVVTGLVDLKTHAKLALVVRRVGGRVQRYAQISTGNYNRATARRYTDVGLFTTDEAIAADLTTLFNELTGASRPPQAEYRTLLVSPANMLQRFLALIEREIDHVRAGGAGRIRAKMNALNETEIVAALYRAAQAGVYVDLVVRGICTLRPGIPGLSERIRVVSLLGRFLEHARIFHFDNDGNPEYYIGSADWRPRNLRRRVEVVTPVRDPGARERLATILDTELDDPFAWELRADGTYVQTAPPTGVELRSAQERFIERARAEH